MRLSRIELESDPLLHQLGIPPRFGNRHRTGDRHSRIPPRCNARAHRQTPVSIPEGQSLAKRASLFVGGGREPQRQARKLERMPALISDLYTPDLPIVVKSLRELCNAHRPAFSLLGPGIRSPREKSGTNFSRHCIGWATLGAWGQRTSVPRLTISAIL